MTPEVLNWLTFPRWAFLTWELRKLSDPPNQLCHMWHVSSHWWYHGLFLQPEHSCIYLCTHLQLLHLPLKRLLPEFLEDMTRLPDWVRAEAAFLFRNFNNLLAEVPKLFYVQSHFPRHSSTSVCPSGPFCRNCYFMASCASHIPFLFIHIFPALPPRPAAHIPPLSAALQLLPSSALLLHLHLADAAMLPSFLHAWGTPFPTSQTLWKSCCVFKVPPDFTGPTSLSEYSQTVQLLFGITLCHEWQNLLMTILRFQEVKKSMSREAGIYIVCFIGENCREWRGKVGHGQLNLIVLLQICVRSSSRAVKSKELQLPKGNFIKFESELLWC